ncbi:MAG: hypothetical protein Ct9H300mP18_13480 [Candidatus Neomarinimicrobiota bacterium]|nr:MAG: hypothetical protein Ct9H300mP18_13480 [Candidatus Neomarinimicrobiota bacterium]
MIEKRKNLNLEILTTHYQKNILPNIQVINAINQTNGWGQKGQDNRT